jgi:beta-1,4-mannosyltransferase
VIVTNSTMFRGNPYHRLIYSALDQQYVAEKGTVESALAHLRGGRSRLLHIHWEENQLRKCASEAEADFISERFVEAIREFSEKQGKIVWTLHNLSAHENEFEAQLSEIRSALAHYSDCALAHNLAACDFLQNEAHVPASKIVHLEHPTYEGFYPPLKEAWRPVSGEFLLFGLLRAYKGIDFLMESTARPASISKNLNIKIRGDVLKGDPFAEQVEQYGQCKTVDLKVGRVADAEVPFLLQTANAILLPYSRFLTSGVALLAITYGIPLIAPNTSQMRELLPNICHALLFESGDKKSLQNAMAIAADQDEEALMEMHDAILQRAADLHPHRISRRLGNLYDELISPN